MATQSRLQNNISCSLNLLKELDKYFQNINIYVISYKMMHAVEKDQTRLQNKTVTNSNEIKMYITRNSYLNVTCLILLINRKIGHLIKDC